jgi:hypothetical protein
VPVPVDEDKDVIDEDEDASERYGLELYFCLFSNGVRVYSKARFDPSILGCILSQASAEEGNKAGFALARTRRQRHSIAIRNMLSR